ncbi:hypothetical protein BTO02_31460 [Paraburkholderia sp. SOS3]|nr:hypothetical protein BTO02_31460 [Paraburkholderia sp. SOS3]
MHVGHATGIGNLQPTQHLNVRRYSIVRMGHGCRTACAARRARPGLVGPALVGRAKHWRG